MKSDHIEVQENGQEYLDSSNSGETNSIDELTGQKPRDPKENHQGLFYGHNDMSDTDSLSGCIGSGYSKRESLQYYDDVKKNLNFDDMDDDEEENSLNSSKSSTTPNENLSTSSRTNSMVSLSTVTSGSSSVVRPSSSRGVAVKGVVARKKWK